MAVLSDFLAAVNQIAAERGIEPEAVYEALEDAIRAGYKRKYDSGEALVVDFDKEKGSVSVYADKKVVKEVKDKSTQVSLENARKIEPKLELGDHVQVDITSSEDFGRIAVQSAKQVILQKVREAEKDAVISEFKDKMGSIETGIVQRMNRENVMVEIRKATVVMPPEERLPGEYYKSGDRLKFLLKDIEKTAKGKRVIVSRADKEFLRELFKLEVPEIRSGSVEIKAVAREAGSRSKVAVVSNQEGVDPIGACVGQKGIRIDNITEELQGEKIDIILWDEDEDIFISNSLSPAEVVSIELYEEERIASVVVEDDQLSLAIGKDGQNVRLAARLTGWKIDIEGETVKEEDLDKDEAKEGEDDNKETSKDEIDQEEDKDKEEKSQEENEEKKEEDKKEEESEKVDNKDGSDAEEKKSEKKGKKKKAKK